MKDFLAMFGIVLVGLVIFFFFGGYMLFDFKHNFWLATLSCAIVISFVVFAFYRLNCRIEELESKLNSGETDKKDA